MPEKFLSLVCGVIDREKDFLNSVSQDIWKNPELKYQEHYAHNLLTDALEKCGFKVTRNYLLPTAFRAEFSSKEGSGPRIAVLLEYDALPEIGHGCGHNLIAEAGLATAIAVKAAIEEDSSLSGKIVVLGTPAEEGGGGKIRLIKKGAFEDIDAAMMVHPASFAAFSPPTLSKLNLTIDFKGRESHASAYPWEGLNALDAAVSFYNSIALLRQQTKPSCRIHVIITKGGSACQLIPADSQVECHLRAPTNDDIRELKVKVENCIEGSSTAAGCSYAVKCDENIAYEYLRTNEVMVKVFSTYAEKLGLPKDGGSEIGYIPLGSTDMGNVSHVVPAIHPIYIIRTNDATHTKEFTEASRSVDAQKPTLAAAKSMAMTVLTLIKNPDIFRAAKNEFLNKL